MSDILLTNTGPLEIYLDGGLRGEQGIQGPSADQLVQSVNAQQGDVVLDYADVGADAAGSSATAQANANSYTNTQIAAINYPVDSVNGQTNTVVLDTDDISEGANKYVTSAEKTKLAVLSGTNTGDQDLSSYASTSYVDAQVAAVEASDVDSFNGRIGTVVPISGDYTATQITNAPAGTIGSSTVQAALNELDTEKAADSAVVHLAGTETITGDKRFNGGFGVNVTPVTTQLATADLGSVLASFGMRTAGTAYPITTSATVSLGNTTVNGIFSTSGNHRLTPQAQTANATLGTTSATRQVCNATAGNIILTLPSAATVSGVTFRVVKTDASVNTVTLQPVLAQTISGATTRVLSTQWSTVSIFSDGTQWIAE